MTQQIADCQHLANSKSTEPLDLDLRQEVTPEGLHKEDLRERIYYGCCKGRFSYRDCFDLFDQHKLWPPDKAEFFATWIAGVMSQRQMSPSDSIIPSIAADVTHRRVA